MADQNPTTILQDAQERWLSIEGFPGYQVSDQGRVRSFWKRIGIRRGGTKFELHIQPQRILNPGIDGGGYLIVSLFRDRKSHTRTVHRLVLSAFVGPCPPGLECCHNDGISGDCTLYNLRWDTRSSNYYDKIEHGLTYYPNSKLFIEQVLKIRELYAQGFLQKNIAKVFGVHKTTIQYIVNRKTWTHI